MTTPINEYFFNTAFRPPPEGMPKYKPITSEKAKELITKAMTFHEEIYLPAEKKEEERLGRPLNFGEQMSLSLHLQHDSK